MKYPNLLDRFLTYVKVNTRSDETSTTTPSTQSQVDFANNVLIPEMKRVGLENVYYLPNGFAIGTLPANDWLYFPHGYGGFQRRKHPATGH